MVRKLCIRHVLGLVHLRRSLSVLFLVCCSVWFFIHLSRKREVVFKVRLDIEEPATVRTPGHPPKNTETERIVYYLWCGDNPQFGFRNYLSFQSAVKFLQPDRIEFLFSVYPKNQTHWYDTWFEEFKDSFPYFSKTDVSRYGPCDSTKKAREFMFSYLYEGGIFIGTSTILTKSALYLWDTHFIDAMLEQRAGILVSSRKVGTENIRLRSNPLRHKWMCPRITGKDIQGSNLTTPCLHLPLEIKPKDIWHKTSSVGRVLNFLMYGEESTPLAKPSEHTVIPNIGHMLWLNGKPIDYLFYLSALSFHYVAKVDEVYIHGDTEPKHTGYWEKLMQEKNIHFSKHVKPNYIYDQKSVHPHLMSDIFRAEIMDKYGGIYADVDVIWTKPIAEELRRYDAVASYDWAHNYAGYPDYINLGVSMGRRRAPFWIYFLQSFKVLKDDLFGFNGLLQPYKIYERHPESMHIDEHLQVMCFRNNCYPRWKTDWKTMDWRTETFAFHWTHPNPPEFQSEEGMLANNTPFAKIGKNVLKAAGYL